MEVSVAGTRCNQAESPRGWEQQLVGREGDGGRPEGEMRVRLVKWRCGQKIRVSRRESAVSDAPTTTTLELTTIL